MFSITEQHSLCASWQRWYHLCQKIAPLTSSSERTISHSSKCKSHNACHNTQGLHQEMCPSSTSRSLLKWFGNSSSVHWNVHMETMNLLHWLLRYWTTTRENTLWFPILSLEIFRTWWTFNKNQCCLQKIKIDFPCSPKCTKRTCQTSQQFVIQKQRG